MPRELFSIPLSRWVHGTIEKMNRFEKRNIESWCEYWLETYKELGGKSHASGFKGCPQHAAYGLWRLGRIRETNIPFKPIPIKIINQKYGRNTAYAAIALDLLEKSQAAESEAGLWIQVQDIFRKITNENPAKSQQGAVTVAKILFEEGHIVTGQE